MGDKRAGRCRAVHVGLRQSLRLSHKEKSNDPINVTPLPRYSSPFRYISST